MVYITVSKTLIFYAEFTKKITLFSFFTPPPPPPPGPPPPSPGFAGSDIYWLCVSFCVNLQITTEC